MTDHKHIVLTSHPSKGGPQPPQVRWAAATANERGPVIGSLNNPQQRNVIGMHSGAYGLYAHSQFPPASSTQSIAPT